MAVLSSLCAAKIPVSLCVMAECRAMFRLRKANRKRKLTLWPDYANHRKASKPKSFFVSSLDRNPELSCAIDSG